MADAGGDIPPSDEVMKMLSSRHVRCPRCKYDLYKSQEPVCAECGLRLTEVVLVDAIAVARMTKTLDARTLEREWSSYRRLPTFAIFLLALAGLFIGVVASFGPAQRQTLQQSGALPAVCISSLVTAITQGACTLVLYSLRLRIRKRARTLLNYANCLMGIMLFAVAIIMLALVNGL
ncbi:MAG: hypothetical protein H7210_05030 [Pyrinomonadaceae bacterium]|nr:hypothetical protein [Phycisphaerales bacterium]